MCGAAGVALRGTTTGGPAMKRPQVMVVDDDEAVRSYLTSFLSALQYDVECCDSGEQALARLDMPACPASLVLLDLLLPCMSGIEVLGRIKQSHPAVPVVVLSTVAEIKT